MTTTEPAVEQAQAKPKYKRAFGNCERCSKQRCAIWFVGRFLLCRLCRDNHDKQSTSTPVER